VGDADGPSTNIAERLTDTRRGWFRKVVTGETVALSDRTTVVRWLREIHRYRDQTIIIHRPWGSVCVVADGLPPSAVLMASDDGRFYAAYPGSTIPQTNPQLTPDQVEHVMVDALTSVGPPRWPEWRQF
jgi:hypothetical protein